MAETNNNLACKFGEDIVSYLYAELESANKIRFESHLKSCLTCTEELSGIALTRSSITEWRDVEFSTLALPKIEIPYEKVEMPEHIGEKRPWYAAIRDLFSLSPAWMTAATAGAALVICLGLFAALISNSRDNNVVVQQTNGKTSPSPTSEIKNQNTVATTPEVVVSKSPGNSPQPAAKDKVTSAAKSETTSIKFSGNSKPTKPQNLTVVKSSQKPEPKNVKVNKNTPKKAPSLVDEEEEDDSLRLSDILEEISMR